MRSSTLSLLSRITEFPKDAGIAALITLCGIVAGVLLNELPIMLSVIAFAGVFVFLITTLHPFFSLGLFLSGIVMMMDDVPLEAVDYFIIPDLDLISGLPSALTMFFLLLFGTTAARMIIKKESPPVRLRYLFIYAGILFFAALTGLRKNTDPILWRVDFMDLLFPVCGFYLFLILVNSPEKVGIILKALFVVTVFKCSILVLFYLLGRGYPYHDYRITTIDNTDLLAAITFLLIAIHLLLNNLVKGGRKLLLATFCVPLLLTVVFSFRRAQWGGLLFSCGLLFLGSAAKARKRMLLISFTAFILGVASMVILGVSEEVSDNLIDRANSIFDPEQSSNVYHALESLQVLRDLSSQPLSGLGLGSHHTPLELYEDDLVPTNVVHNTFLYVWMKAGLPALLFFLIGWRLLIKKSVQSIKAGSGKLQSALVLPITASMGLWLAMFVSGPTPWYQHQTFMLAFWASSLWTLLRSPPTPAQAEVQP